MSGEPITVLPDSEITAATRLILEKRINGVPVVDVKGRLVDILCQSDLIAEHKKLPIPSYFILLDGLIPLTSLKHIEKKVEKIAASTVASAMTPDPVTVSPETTIEEVAALIVDKTSTPCRGGSEEAPGGSGGQGGCAAYPGGGRRGLSPQVAWRNLQAALGVK